MKKIKYIIIVLILLFSTASSLHAQAIKDPFADSLSGGQYSSNDQVFSFTTKFSDGKEYIFITLTNPTWNNGKAGNIFNIYEKLVDGYIALDEPVTLNIGALALTEVDGINGLNLITYWPNSAESGALRAIQIKDGVVLDKNIGEIKPTSKDSKLYSDLFENEKTKITFQKLDIKDLVKSEDSNRKSTITKWIFVVVVLVGLGILFKRYL